MVKIEPIGVFSLQIFLECIWLFKAQILTLCLGFYLCKCNIYESYCIKDKGNIFNVHTFYMKYYSINSKTTVKH